jgi:hypothetical protein
MREFQFKNRRPLVKRRGIALRYFLCDDARINTVNLSKSTKVSQRLPVRGADFRCFESTDSIARYDVLRVAGLLPDPHNRYDRDDGYNPCEANDRVPAWFPRSIEPAEDDASGSSLQVMSITPAEYVGAASAKPTGCGPRVQTFSQIPLR